MAVTPGEAAREALKRLTQGKKSVAEYKAKFEEHSSLTSWSKADLRSCFYDGLADAIKDTLVISDRPTEAYESLVEAAQVLDIHVRQRQAEKKGQTFHQTSSQSCGTESMPIDINALCQQQGGRQGQSALKKPNCSDFLKKMKGKCFGYSSSDHICYDPPQFFSSIPVAPVTAPPAVHAPAPPPAVQPIPVQPVAPPQPYIRM